MTTKSNFSVYILVALFFSITQLYAQQNWVIGAEKFSSNNSNNPVYNVLEKSLPSLILENIGSSLNRDIKPDEQYERTLYELEKSRISLFLQLSAEYKKRDALVLGDYSQKQLVKKQKEADLKIKEIQDKILDNLEQQKTAKEKSLLNMQLVESGKYENKVALTEGQKWLYFFKNLFVKNEKLIEQETISFYKDDSSFLFSPSEKTVEDGVSSYNFEKEVLNASINALLHGNISVYGEYLSVNVDAYLFPGAKKLSSVIEVGSIKEIDLIANNIALKLVPVLTNALPVELKVEIAPSEIQNAKFYLDDELLNFGKGKQLTQSGIHNIQIKADGYKSISTTYNFLGNRKYLIEVNMEPEVNAFIYLDPKDNSSSAIFANGKSTEKINNNYSRIKINGQTILGQFVNTDGLSGFYYVPEKYLKDGAVVKVRVKEKDTSAYVEKRRKWMYGSYSALLVSLIPTFVTRGEFENYAGAYMAVPTQEGYDKAKKWAMASDVSAGVSIGAGVLFGYELVRYLIAANSVLPKKAKKTDIIYIENNTDSYDANIEESEKIHTEE